AWIEKAEPAKAAAVVTNGLESDVHLPRRTLKEIVHRRQRENVDQSKPVEPGSIAPVIMAQRDAQGFDLRVGGVSVFRVEQIVVGQAKIELVENLSLAPARAESRAHDRCPCSGGPANGSMASGAKGTLSLLRASSTARLRSRYAAASPLSPASLYKKYSDAASSTSAWRAGGSAVKDRS